MNSESIERVYRFCPRCGTEAEEEGIVPFRCKPCGFAQFFGPVAAVGGLVTNDAGELLLVRRARDPGKGKWGLPGGFVDREETIEQALTREIREETGMTVVDSQYLTSFPNLYDYAGFVSPVIDFFYLCRVGDPTQVSLDADELESYLWVQPTGEHLAEMAFSSNRQAIEQWLGSR